MKRSFLAAFCAAALASGGAFAQGLPDTIKIGVLNDMSSLYADNGGAGSVAAAKMAVEDFGGSVLGKKIEIINADHQNKPDTGAALARQWFDQGVVMIDDVPTSSVGLAVQEVARSTNKLVINVGAATSDLTGKACAATGLHWVYNTVALANGTGSAVVKAGGDTWFFITADYAFGHALERDTTAVVEKAGGKVIGSVKVPLNNADFSSFLLQAQASKAKIVGLANAGGDTQNSIKQAAEFGIVAGGQKLAGLLVFVADIHSLGLPIAQGLQFTESFYWDQDDQTRAWAKKFFDKMHKEPTMEQAGVYSSVFHYLEAVKATNSVDGPTVTKELKSKPVNDFVIRNGHFQEDGMLVHDMYLYEAKKPSESKGEWDLYKLIATIPGDQAYKRANGNECPLVKG